MVSKLKKPRRVMLLVKAGEAVDQFIGKLVSTVCLVCDTSLVTTGGQHLQSFAPVILEAEILFGVCLSKNHVCL
jgi:hypothetical protein